MKNTHLSCSQFKTNGFTLIEVLISIAILSTLGLLAAQTIKQAIRSKKEIQSQVNETSKLRDAVKIMERDIQLAFHFRDWEKEIIDLNKKRKKSTANPNPVNQVPQFDANGLPILDSPSENVEAPRKDPTTFFIGRENEIHLTTLNTGRILKDLPQADFVEVGYTLKDCQSLDGKKNSKCLFRRLSPWVDTDVTKGGDEVLLLENVTEFSLKYIGRGKQDWVKDWKTDNSGDGITKGNFPWSVEISIATQNVKEKEESKTKKYSMQVVVPIHFTNNKDDFGTVDVPSQNSANTSTATPNVSGSGIPSGGDQ